MPLRVQDPSYPPTFKTSGSVVWMTFKICEDVLKFRMDGGRYAIGETEAMKRSGSFTTNPNPVTCGSLPIYMA